MVCLILKLLVSWHLTLVSCENCCKSLNIMFSFGTWFTVIVSFRWVEQFIGIRIIWFHFDLDALIASLIDMSCFMDLFYFKKHLNECFGNLLVGFTCQIVNLKVFHFEWIITLHGIWLFSKFSHLKVFSFESFGKRTYERVCERNLIESSNCLRKI